MLNETYRRSRWCLFKQKLAGEDPTQPHSRNFKIKHEQLTKIDTDRAFVDLVSHDEYGFS
jgi:hypothetical protein